MFGRVNSIHSVYSDKVQAICYIQLTRQLVSCSADGGIAVWNMDISREEVSVCARSKALLYCHFMNIALAVLSSLLCCPRSGHPKLTKHW